MQDFTNPYLTQQAKKDMLALEIDKEYLKEKSEQNKKGNPFSSSSYWIVSVRDLIEFNKASIADKNTFTFNEEKFDSMCPDFDVILLEHDNVKKGEYDNFNQKWSTTSYVNCCAVGCNGYICGELPNGIDEEQHLPLNVYSVDKDKYPYNAERIRNEHLIWGIGLIDIPTELLDKFEDKRVYKRIYSFSKLFEQMMHTFLKNNFADTLKGINFNKKASVKKIRKKRFNKGFGNAE